MNSKYVGNVYEGRWKVVSLIKGKYKIENIYNQKSIEISKTQMYRIGSGKSTVSQIITFRLARNKEKQWNTLKPRKYVQSLHAMRRKEIYGR